MTPEEELPKTLTSYSPCFRKEKGAPVSYTHLDHYGFTFLQEDAKEDM